MSTKTEAAPTWDTGTIESIQVASGPIPSSPGTGAGQRPQPQTCAGRLPRYGQMVTPGCGMVAANPLVGHLSEENAPKKRSKIWFNGDAPLSALHNQIGEPDQSENDKVLNGMLVLSSSPGAYSRKKAI